MPHCDVVGLCMCMHLECDTLLLTLFWAIFGPYLGHVWSMLGACLGGLVTAEWRKCEELVRA
jgi:hypothetical protein